MRFSVRFLFLLLLLSPFIFVPIEKYRNLSLFMAMVFMLLLSIILDGKEVSLYLIRGFYAGIILFVLVCLSLSFFNDEYLFVPNKLSSRYFLNVALFHAGPLGGAIGGIAGALFYYWRRPKTQDLLSS